MEAFKNYLQQEYLRRSGQSPQFSLRAYAQQLGVNHATLSSMLSGKRKITKRTIQTLSKPLGLSPEETFEFLHETKESSTEEKKFYQLQNDSFLLISDWYFDAILELSLIPHANLEPQAIASVLNISTMKAKLALETLERLELLKRNDLGKYVSVYKNTKHFLDSETTASAQKNYQRVTLERSLEALAKIERPKRDHTSTTMAINVKDLPAAKEIIKKFRHDLNDFMQRDQSLLDEVYQLQVSFFPVTESGSLHEN